MNEYKLPDVGEGLTEAEIVSWKVREGDTIAVNDVVVEIETAKSIVELPSPYAGTVLAILVPEGETVAVGTPIVRIGEESEAAADTPAGEAPPEGADGEAPSGGAADASAEDRAPIDTNVPPEGNSTLVGYGPREVVARRRARRGSASPPTAAGASSQMQLQGAFAPGGAQSQHVVEDEEPAVPSHRATTTEAPTERVLAKPPVRKLAKDLGVDLATLTPTGPHGTVSREDVQQAATGGDRVAEPAGATGGDRVARPVEARGGERREPIKGVRKMMGEAMVASAFSAPHVTEWVTVDATRTMQYVEQLRAHRDFRDLKVSPLLVVARACLLAMRRTPEINSWWDDEAGEVVYKDYVNLGLAAATPRGLVVPNVKNAQDLALPDLAREIGELTATAREGRTQPAEMSGGTFTITNIGVFGIDSGTPIINPGESAILALGAIRKQPWVHEDEVAVRHVTTLALSFDHRHVDGEKGSRFLADVASVVEDPANALLL